MVLTIHLQGLHHFHNDDVFWSAGMYIIIFVVQFNIHTIQKNVFYLLEYFSWKCLDPNFFDNLDKTVFKGLKWPQANQVYLWWSLKDKCLTQSKILILQMWQTIVEWLFSLFPFSLYYRYILSVEYKYELCFALPPTLAAHGIAMSIVWKLIIFRLHTSLHTKQLYPSIIIDINEIKLFPHTHTRIHLRKGRRKETHGRLVVRMTKAIATY